MFRFFWPFAHNVFPYTVTSKQDATSCFACIVLSIFMKLFNRTSEDMCSHSFVFILSMEPAEPLNIALRGALFIKNIYRKDEIKSNYVCSYED